MEYILEIHKTARRKRKPFGTRFKEYRGYFKTTGSKQQIRRLERKMKRKGWNTLSYQGNYARSSKYRDVFFANNEPKHGKYHCVYCGRTLKREAVVVDHIVPVGAAKRGGLARRLLHGKGVNDKTNLVSACERCNAKKRDKLGLWPVKAALGRHRGYFVIKRTVKLIAFCWLLYGAYTLMKMYSPNTITTLKECIRTWLHYTKAWMSMLRYNV